MIKAFIVKSAASGLHGSQFPILMSQQSLVWALYRLEDWKWRRSSSATVLIPLPEGMDEFQLIESAPSIILCIFMVPLMVDHWEIEIAWSILNLPVLSLRIVHKYTIRQSVYLGPSPGSLLCLPWSWVCPVRPLGLMYLGNCRLSYHGSQEYHCHLVYNNF